MRSSRKRDLVREKLPAGEMIQEDISYISEDPTMPATYGSIARVFMSGSSQAVRLPKAFRFEVDEVSIRKEGDELILSPLKPRPWPKATGVLLGLWAMILKPLSHCQHPNNGTGR